MYSQLEKKEGIEVLTYQLNKIHETCSSTNREAIFPESEGLEKFAGAEWDAHPTDFFFTVVAWLSGTLHADGTFRFYPW